VAQTSKGKVSHVGFRNPDGSYVMVLANTGQQARTQLLLGTRTLELDLAADSVSTLEWS
jgi:O-glycosyl hydrolase